MADGDRSFARWLLLDGNRHVVALALLAVVFLLLVVLGSIGTIALDDPDAVRGVAGGLIPGLFTFLSIVLAINQLVLSQEFGSADEIRERVAEIREFRRDVEDVAGAAPSPILPTSFLAVVVHAVESTAATLGDDLPADLDQQIVRAVEGYVDAVVDDARRAGDVLERSESGRVHAILSVLEFEDSRYLYDARRIRHDAGEALPAETRDALDELVDVLELFGVARTHFRTTYTQRVLAKLSRLLLYVGVPALLASAVLALTPSEFQAITPTWTRTVAVSSLLAFAFSPLAVLFAFLLRIATVSERTIAVGPFVSRPGGDDRMTTSGAGTSAVDGSRANGSRSGTDAGLGTDAESGAAVKSETDAESDGRQ